MQRQVALAQGEPGAEIGISIQEALASRFPVTCSRQRRMSQRAADLAQQAGEPEGAARWETGAALREAFFVNAPE